MRFTRALCLISGFGIITPALAQWSAGVIGLGQSNPYIGGETGLDVFPIIAYEGEKLVWRGPFLDYYVVGKSRSKQSLSLNIALAPSDFDPDGDPVLAGITERKNSVMAGVTYQQEAYTGTISASMQTEVTNRHRGQRATLGWEKAIARDDAFQWQLVAGIEVEYLSADYANYYYGISESESLNSNFAEYTVGSVVQPELTLGGYYRFNPKWQMIASVGLQKLSSDVKDSPIVDADWVADGFIGVVYQF